MTTESTAENSTSKPKRGKPTKLFIRYCVELAVRLSLFIYAIYLFVNKPYLLDIDTYFGLAHGFNSVDLFFIALVIDISIKFFPNAHIAMGSLKQYGGFHAPTLRIIRGGKDALMQYVQDLVKSGRLAIDETRAGALESVRDLMRSIDILRLLPFSNEQLSVTEQLRSSIRRERFREILPVIIFWIVWNVAIGLALGASEHLNQRTVLLWVLFYFVFDMICVVFWCPLQIFMMKNRCCTTCQIFNWDAIMTTTPLFIILPSPFAILLLTMALVVLLRWELAVARHPERFDERTNASLLCINCTDKLCYLRPPVDATHQRNSHQEDRRTNS